MRKLVVAMALLSVACVSAANENRRDGNWWRDLNHNNRIAYVMGYVDAETENVSCFDDKAYTRASCSATATYLQLVDGLTQFYIEARNRSIKLEHAIPVVVAGFGGSLSTSQLENVTVKWRKTDSGS